MNYAFTKYWVEGEKEAIHTLFNAFTDNDGWASNTLNKLGINESNYDADDAEWNKPTVEDKDGYSVLYFEEAYPYERGNIIDLLMNENMFKDKLTKLYYYEEESAMAQRFETNDATGKYFPYSIFAHVIDDWGDIADEFYCKDEQELINSIRTKYNLSEEMNTIETLKKYFEESDKYESLYVNTISIIS